MRFFSSCIVTTSTTERNKMINLEEYKKALELETVTIQKIQLDVYFSYSKDSGFQLDFVEDVTGAQDLMPIMAQGFFDDIIDELTELYRKRGWL